MAQLDAARRYDQAVDHRSFDCSSSQHKSPLEDFLTWCGRMKGLNSATLVSPLQRESGQSERLEVKATWNSCFIPKLQLPPMRFWKAQISEARKDNDKKQSDLI